MAKEIQKLTDEQRKMVEDNLAFATYVAKRFFGKDYIKNQDIFQEAVISMCKAMTTYDSEKAKLTTYMFPTINGHLKRYTHYKDRIIPIPHQKHLKLETQQKRENAKNILSLDKKYANENNSTLMNIIPDESNIEEQTVNKIILTEAIKQLEWKEKIVIIYRFYFDLSQTMIGEIMLMSQVHVHRLEKRALEKIKVYMLGDN